jgi:2-oxoglutarate ferredoxin oxidoreductase subunit alpha
MREFIDGNEVIARAAIHAGCNFFAGYPITPATSILLHMTRDLPKTGGIAIQGEDEIASISFCIGAALTGKRVMTATSGPGISLYSESIGAAIMLEVPMVIVDVQRMGPATGAPTLGAYGDIQFVRWGNSGGYPLIALCPTNVIDCYDLTRKAFVLADLFRVPVFLLTDKEIGLTKTTVESIAISGDDWAQSHSTNFQINDQTTAPTTQTPIFGGQDLIRLTTSSHDQRGYLTKDPNSIREHNQHLIDKIMNHIDKISMVDFDHIPGSTTLVISYGITSQSVRDAVREARRNGNPVSFLIIYSLWPVPEEVLRKILKNFKNIIIPELNLGLYRREIERLTSDQQDIISLTRLDGGLITPKELLTLL